MNTFQTMLCEQHVFSHEHGAHPDSQTAVINNAWPLRETDTWSSLSAAAVPAADNE